MKKIAILLHHSDSFPKKKYYILWYFIAEWEKLGYKIEIVKGIPNKRPEVDVWLPHLDRSVRPPEYIEFLQECPNVLNKNVHDITKRKISTLLLDKNDAYDKPVIVKTNNNYGGLPEYRSGFVKRLKRQWDKRVLWVANRNLGKISTINPKKYPVYSSKSEVPDAVWFNPDLIVEKFLPEREGDYYGMRSARFLGDRFYNTKYLDKTPVVKGSPTRIESEVEIPAFVHEFHRNWGLDYGKIDYVVHDDTVHVIDVNKTYGASPIPGRSEKIAAFLAEGIRIYL